MSGPKFADLIRGRESEVQEMGGGRAFARGLGQGASLSFADEGAGLVDAVGEGYGRLARGDFEVSGDGLSDWYEKFVGDYLEGRDEARNLNAAADATHGAAYLGGQVTGGLATGALTGGAGLGAGLGLRGAVALGAGEGALTGLGGSSAELTDGDVLEYARAGGDALVGAGYGAAGGAVGYGVGKGLQALGGRAKAALGRARGALVDEAAGAERQALQDILDEVDAAHGPGLEMNKRGDAAARLREGREAARLAREQGQGLEMDRALAERRARAPTEEVLREAPPEPRTQADLPRRAAMREQEALERAQGQGLEMNKGYDARAEAPTQGAALARSAGIPEPRVAPREPLPNGRVRGPARAEELGDEAFIGYERKAHQQVMHQADMVRARQAGLERGDYIPGERTMMQRYVDNHLGARQNPGAARREAIHGWLAQRYGDDAAAELIQRFDDAGRYLPSGRPALDAAGAAAEEATSVSHSYADAAAREGLSPEEYLRRYGGGGGSALDGLSNANTQVDLDMRGTPQGAAQSQAERVAGVEAMAREMEQGLPTRQFDPQADAAAEALVRRLDAAGLGRRVRGSAPTANMRAPRAPEPSTGGLEEATPSVPPPPGAQAPLFPGGGAPPPSQVSPLPPRGVPPAQWTAGPTPRTPVQQAIPVQGPRGTPPGAPTPRLPPPGYASPQARAAAQAREAGAGRDVLKAAYRGATGARNSLMAPVGAAWEVGKAAFTNPAVRARAIAASRLHRLAGVSPGLFARVGASLSEALGKGPAEYAVTRHVLLQTEPEYRQAEAQADREDAELSEEEFLQRLEAEGVL